MSEDTFVSLLPENEENPLVADAMAQTPDAPDRPAPEQTLEEYEAEMDRLAKEAEEEAARLAQEMTESLPIEPDEDEYTPEDCERDIEFGRP